MIPEQILKRFVFYMHFAQINIYLNCASSFKTNDYTNRSFRRKDIPVGFPEEFRSLAFHGRQDGSLGPKTYFYSEV